MPVFLTFNLYKFSLFTIMLNYSALLLRLALLRYIGNHFSN